MAVVLDGSGPTGEGLERITRRAQKVELAPDALERIGTCPNS